MPVLILERPDLNNISTGSLQPCPAALPYSTGIDTEVRREEQRYISIVVAACKMQRHCIGMFQSLAESMADEIELSLEAPKHCS